jgi:ergothioneine biosynthesis protein EgtB
MPRTDASDATQSARYAAVRAATVALIDGLTEEDCQAQSMPDASPAKWHLAHTTWFFETFVLEPFEPGFVPFDPAFRVLFNSYYQGVGPQHARPRRGLLTRPTLAQVLRWRDATDARVLALLDRAATRADGELQARVELGLHHEQQHQELLVTDVLHLLSCNPLAPAWRSGRPKAAETAPEGFVDIEGGVVEIGHAGDGFAFDNETPRHRVYLTPYRLARGLVTRGQWQAFVDDGAYREPRWWLAAGWDWLRAQGIDRPGCWRDGGREFTPHGLQPGDPAAPVRHISYYEADAFARWAGARQSLPLRLPTEAEWEHAASRVEQAFGEVWQWTSSAYAAYPGFRAWDGAVGEYNAKFMASQFVLRGSSLATPPGHSRATYRNFFPPDARWQFTGLRLACDAT